MHMTSEYISAYAMSEYISAYIAPLQSTTINMLSTMEK